MQRRRRTEAQGSRSPDSRRVSSGEDTVAVPTGFRVIALLFTFGVLASLFAAFTLVFPGTALDAAWRVNPAGHAGMLRLGAWAVLLMLGVCAACITAAYGLFTGRAWGRAVAIGGLAVNLCGDVLTAVLRHEPATLIGVPIALALIIYLWRAPVTS